jgi:hypothetical protein
MAGSLSVSNSSKRNKAGAEASRISVTGKKQNPNKLIIAGRRSERKRKRKAAREIIMAAGLGVDKE